MEMNRTSLVVVALSICAVALTVVPGALYASSLQETPSFTAVRLDDCLDSPCDTPSAHGVWRMDPGGVSLDPGTSNPKHPSWGARYGLLVQRIEVDYNVCQCSVTYDSQLGYTVSIDGCQSTTHTHYEMRILRGNARTRTDRLALSGNPPAEEASIIGATGFRVE